MRAKKKREEERSLYLPHRSETDHSGLTQATEAESQNQSANTAENFIQPSEQSRVYILTDEPGSSLCCMLNTSNLVAKATSSPCCNATGIAALQILNRP